MGISLEKPTESSEFEPRTASRSFLFEVPRPTALEPVADPQTLFEHSQNIQARSADIGYPSLILHGIDDLTFASVAAGSGDDGKSMVWQINARDNNQAHILYGEVTEESETWQLISQDHQGRQWQVAASLDEELSGRISAFVLGAISQAGDLEAAGSHLLQTKAEAKNDYDNYKKELAELDKCGYGNKKLRNLLGSYSQAAFSSLGTITLKNVVKLSPKKDDAAMDAASLPANVNKLLASRGHTASIYGFKVVIGEITETE